MTDENWRRMELSIHGRVQRVGFRHFTVTKANRLNDVTGWVKNERDGSVQLVAEGPPDQLDQLKSAVQEGPARARVDNIQTEYKMATGEFSSFKVRY